MRHLGNMLLFVVLGCALRLSAQDVFMHPNAGQWDDRIEYKIELGLGELIIEKDGFLFYLNDVKEKIRGHHGDEHSHTHAHSGDEEVEYNFHVIRSKFIGSSWKGVAVNSDSSSHYRNYLLGTDQSKWKSNLHSYQTVRMKDFYEGVDLILDTKNGNLKYSFDVAPGADFRNIKFRYEGHDKIHISEEGDLVIGSRFGDIVESKPTAWIEFPNGKQKVAIEFALRDGEVSFVIDEEVPEYGRLVIDPNLTFSTFTGSTSDNWGMSATPDINGNLFGGGTVFGASGAYPVTPGAYSSTNSGGSVDIGITKFNDVGTALIYSTYLGGNGSETPNSMIANAAGELFIFGITSSSNFPMAGASYDNSYNGGPNLSTQSNGLGFSQGADIFVARLSANGSSLIASTYVGGSGADGMNTSNLKYNYGDQFRGEIILDDNQNVYVSSTTQSVDFPTVLATQTTLSGTQDAVIFKMPPTLNTLLWSTYFGSTGVESGNSIQIASNGNVYVAGGTSSNSLPFPMGQDLTYNGGQSDGYVMRMNGNTGGILSGTFMGMNEYDQTFFVQLDIDDKVYVLGQSESNWGVTPGTFGVANSGQFVRKYSSDLSTIEWTTMIGAGTGNVEISPTAFLVSDCYDIYLSGWGGQLNQNPQYSQAVNSTTNGFPLTTDAYQSVTNGSNFYIAVLGENAGTLKYGTYMGGTSSAYNHVDGGTSRFDKTGRIYHAVCGSCGGGIQNGFTTTPGAYSNLALGPNCNMACFKFELSKIDAIVSNPVPIVCIPDPVIFNNNSANGNAFFWNFGDNTTSTAVNPTHYYTTPGTYTVTLVVSDTNGCFTPDSVQFDIYIGSFEGGVVDPPAAICPGEPFQFEAYGGQFYEWSPAQYLDDPTVFNPTATVNQTTNFQVIISDSCGVDTVDVTLVVYQNNISVSNDTSICIGNDVPLFATGGVSYLWTPSDFLDDPNSATPISTPTANISYNVLITTAEGCEIEDTVNIDVYYTPPIPVMPDLINLCRGSAATITVAGGQTYAWSPGTFITPVTGPVVSVNPTSDMYYYCDFTNACGTVRDSVFIDVVWATIEAFSDTIICPGESATLWATGGVSYNWSPANTLSSAAGAVVAATPSQPTTYLVVGTDQYGCVDQDSVFVDLYPKAFIQTVPDIYAFLGDVVQLGATSSTPGPYTWYPSEYLSCVVCPSPTASPDQNFLYTVSYTDANGCSASDTIRIYYDPVLYIPNTFTPGDNNTLNTIFKAEGGNIATFEMLIFNRWGELIHTINKLEDGWDGKYQGAPCQDGTYTWKVKLTDFEGKEQIHVGHVNLLR